MESDLRQNGHLPHPPPLLRYRGDRDGQGLDTGVASSCGSGGTKKEDAFKAPAGGVFQVPYLWFAPFHQGGSPTPIHTLLEEHARGCPQSRPHPALFSDPYSPACQPRGGPPQRDAPHTRESLPKCRALSADL
ncbi:unnamed protein product [Ixodes persulcatus]